MAMKAQELRIGNWVWQGERYGNCKVDPSQIGRYANHLKNGYEADYYSEWKPIPLTPEILEKAGFERVGNSNRFKCVGLTVYYYLSCADDYANGFGCKLVFSDNPGDIGYAPFMAEPIYNLHQLQNLYHSLCGEELNIEL